MAHITKVRSRLTRTNRRPIFMQYRPSFAGNRLGIPAQHGASHQRNIFNEYLRGSLFGIRPGPCVIMHYFLGNKVQTRPVPLVVLVRCEPLLLTSILYTIYTYFQQKLTFSARERGTWTLQLKEEKQTASQNCSFKVAPKKNDPKTARVRNE